MKTITCQEIFKLLPGVVAVTKSERREEDYYLHVCDPHLIETGYPVGSFWSGSHGVSLSRGAFEQLLDYGNTQIDWIASGLTAEQAADWATCIVRRSEAPNDQHPTH